MSFFNTISKNDVVFPTPLIVATAPRSLLYILRCKNTLQCCGTWQGRSVNTFDDRNKEVCVFSLLCVALAIGEVARKDGGGSPREYLCRYFGAMFNSNGISGVYPLRILHSCG